MIRVYLLLLVLVLAFFAIRAFIKAPPQRATHYIRLALYGVGTVMVLFLALTGRLNWLTALLSIVAAAGARLLPLLIKHAPNLHKIWALIWQIKQQSTKHRYDTHGRNASKHGGMDREQAYSILGIKPGASKQEIIDAHRKLMQKMHPDRGGSNYLAGQINKAKKTLLDS